MLPLDPSRLSALPPPTLLGDVTCGRGEAGNGTCVSELRLESSKAILAAGAIIGEGDVTVPAACRSFMADAASNAAFLMASDAAADLSSPASAVTVTGAVSGGPFVGVTAAALAIDCETGAFLAGVVVMEEAVAVTGPMASFSSPNSFHSSTSSSYARKSVKTF